MADVKRVSERWSDYWDARYSWEDGVSEWAEAKREIEESDTGIHDAGQSARINVERACVNVKNTTSQGTRTAHEHPQVGSTEEGLRVNSPSTFDVHRRGWCLTDGATGH